MANECNNEFVVAHDDPTMIDRFESAFIAGRLLREFIPIPNGLYDGDARCPDEVLKASNIAQYGAESRYCWSIKNWGTKWDVGEFDSGRIERDDQNLIGSFVSASEPPLAAFLTLKDMGFRYELRYDEPGCTFIGILSWDGAILRDDCYDFSIENMTIDGVSWNDEIPEEFHEIIKGYYRDWIPDFDGDSDIDNNNVVG